MSIPPPPSTQALNSTTFCPPPLNGLLTLPEVYDWHLSHSGTHPLFIYGDDSSNTGTAEILWAEGVKAIHNAARVITLRATTDGTPSSPPTVAIFASSDTISYFCTMMGVLRAGFPLFLISPRLSLAALTHLLSTTDVSHVMVDDEPSVQTVLTSAVTAIHDQHPDRQLSVSPMMKSADLFSDSLSAAPSLPTGRFKPDTVAIMTHTSGTTTLPKKVAWTHRMLMQQMWIPWYGERDMTGEILACHAIPTYGPAGVMQAVFSASCGLVIATFKSSLPPTVPNPENVFRGILDTKSTFAFVVPPLLNIWSHDSAKILALKSMKGVVYTGGPLNKEVGDKLSEQGVNLFTMYASSENGVMNRVFTNSVGKQWEWFTLSPHCHPEFKPEGSGFVELILKLAPSHYPAVINTNWNGNPAFASNDLLAAHPEKPGYWKFIGRSDDQIELSTGEKMNAGAFERILVGDPLVAGAVIFSRRPKVGAILEPTKSYGFDPTNEKAGSTFKDAVWSTVEAMNAIAPTHGRIEKEMIIIASPSKPFAYGVKGTPRRKTVVTDYETEIDVVVNDTK